MEISLRNIRRNDLKEYADWLHPRHDYHKLNGPYFKKASPTSIKDKIAQLEQAFLNGHLNPLDQKKMIINSDDQIIGEVSWTWRSKETLWMEVGIVLFDAQYRGKGIGFLALSQWISHLFNTHHHIVRLGLTTWSGNIGMIKLAEKLQLKKEAQYRKARIVNGVYHDSISYGILREEWDNYLTSGSLAKAK